ncbi:hypothetical protein HK099_000934 [Clydaea vesicula]|uniref:Photolyase/cryptochrome alpha/beta domain-containing protein n=1 Tax=Clydaea vesicula TaxID=447962 RepID=A0AAD5Y1F5_9FUNG|nr:hypothetical protein HK099_000934 [Clydaea vesicula]KAJ3391324.1 hypothetical protein HDU92_009091 [Lobulomyces angularis]
MPLSKKNKLSSQTVVHWFRVDLRTSDNAALHLASLKAKRERMPLIGLYIISAKDWKRHDASNWKVNFILKNLSTLKVDLETKFSIPLIIKVAENIKDVYEILKNVVEKLDTKYLYFNQEYEVHENQRDEMVQAILDSVEVKRIHDQCIVMPGSVLTQEGNIPKVFTPFKRSWIKFVYQSPVKTFPSPEKSEVELQPLAEDYIRSNSTIPFPNHDNFLNDFVLSTEKADFFKTYYPIGEDSGLARLTEFVEKKIEKYKVTRDYPALEGTSNLSPYITNGIISSRTAFLAAFKKNNERLESGNENITTWISEIIWREFYKHILVGYPRVSKNKPFKLETDNIQWNYDEKLFKAWCDGKTGYPFVDAGMRELNTTGRMHNRLRMVVSNFLTKDLLIDWRLGERYFMQNLIDGDLSSNNGGWQWSASTGTDSQPYFRLFNPILQSKKFDKDGVYIKKYVKELRNCSGSSLHTLTAQLQSFGYPKPIVDHSTARELCLTEFKRIYNK